MTKISQITLALVCGFSSIVNAGFSNQYVASRLSYVDMHYKDSFSGAKSSDDVAAISAAYGFNFSSSLRLEAELNLHSSKDIEHEIDLWDYGYYFNETTSVSTTTSMFNIYYDFVNSSRLTPYLLAGAGFSYVSYNYDMYHILGDGRTFHQERDDDDTNFAWQAGLGLSFKINQHFTADLMGKYADLGSYNFRWNTSKTRQRENMISAGVRYMF